MLRRWPREFRVLNLFVDFGDAGTTVEDHDWVSFYCVGFPVPLPAVDDEQPPPATGAVRLGRDEDGLDDYALRLPPSLGSLQISGFAPIIHAAPLSPSPPGLLRMLWSSQKTLNIEC